MEATIVNYRMGRHRQYNNQMIIQVNSIDKREKARHLIGKKVLWLSPTKKELTGIIKKEHGKNGALRVVFDKGLPGQALGTKLQIMEK
ncbi:MAG: 50S ribosomal protein L35ae [Nanoarchaeota archaeon]